MFNPAQATTPAASVRSSRRRQRPLSNEGSISQPKAKRLRSALNEKTFAPPDADEAPEMEEIKSSQVATLPRRDTSKDFSGLQKEVVVRGRKARTTEQSSKGDGSVLLTTNDTFSVSKLPALPDRLRSDVTGRYHGAIDSESGYSFALTHTHAIIWPYTINMASPETFTFALPQPSKHISDPLPLGCLVSPSASSTEPGIVVVVPSTGRITYWESISSAATLDLRLQRSGVDFTIPGMLSGETVVQLLNAESAGFVLGFSSGRIAYMSVRDGQGRPAISVQFLRGTGATATGGLFGSLRNVLSSTTWKGDIAAIRAGRSDKVGQREVVVATAKGRIQGWQVHRGGHTSLVLESDSREDIVMAIKEAVPSLSDLNLESFELLDFTYTPRSIKETQLVKNEDDGLHLLLLTSLKDKDSSHYCLIEATIKSASLNIGIIRPIKSYTTPVGRNCIAKTRLYLPNPALVAYVVFDKAVVVVSMAQPVGSVDNQLLGADLTPQNFEDVVDLRDDLDIEIVGSGIEEPTGLTTSKDEVKSRRHRPKHPATVLLVRGGGVIRVAASDTVRLTSTSPPKVTARSKLEQAVFFGTIDQNPLSFSVRPELQFSVEEVSSAALDLSLDILRSRTPYIPSVPASIDQNLRKRSKALSDLAKYIQASGIVLDRDIKWRLLAFAEKMAAALAIWKQYDATLKDRPEGEKRGLLSELVEYIHEDWKTEAVAEAGELDRVRHWFIHDVWNLEVALPWAFQVIKYTYQNGQRDHAHVFKILSEANDVVIGALQGAFEFRSANLEVYGLENEQLENGILKTGYDSLPEPWTSINFIAENLQKQCALAGFLTKDYWEQEDGPGKPSQKIVQKVRKDHPKLLDVSILANNERIQWEEAQDSPQSQMTAEERRQHQTAAEDEQLKVLADLDLVDEAINLAEKYEILPSLASIILDEMAGIRQYAPRNQDDKNSKRRRLEQLISGINSFFVEFGSRWASAFFECLISGRIPGSIHDLFERFTDHRQYLTKFLHHHPEYAKISWIQDVVHNQDFDASSKTLLDLGLSREQDVWCKQVELSIGKLARLAGLSHSSGINGSNGPAVDVVLADNELALIGIQNEVFNHVWPSVSAAIDEKAELQLALEAHGNKKLRNKPRLLSLLEDGMAHLIRHEAMQTLTLVDLLTLMTETEDDSPFRGRQFYLALQAIRRSSSGSDEKQLVQRIVWRRCMLQDDWVEVNDTNLKDDSQVSEQLRKTALYLTLRSCLEKRLFDEGTNVKPISPEDVLGAGTDQVDGRFKRLDASIQESVMRDMQAEDDDLMPFIHKSRLGRWFQAALELAKQDHADKLAAETADGQRIQQAQERLRELELGILDKERARADQLLHSNVRYKPKAKLNGTTNFRASIKRY